MTLRRTPQAESAAKVPRISGLDRHPLEGVTHVLFAQEDWHIRELHLPPNDGSGDLGVLRLQRRRVPGFVARLVDRRRIPYDSSLCWRESGQASSLAP